MQIHNPTFYRYPKEEALIGRMVVGYGGLEYSLALCVSMITGDRDMTFKVMFRTRGESHRINMGDALAREKIQQGRIASFSSDRSLE